MNVSNIKKFFLSAALIMSFNTWSAGTGLNDMMAGLDSLDKKQVEQMIDMLQKAGNISADEAKKAKAELGKMSDSDFKGLKKKANTIVEENKKKESDYEHGTTKKSITTTDKGAFGLEVE